MNDAEVTKHLDPEASANPNVLSVSGDLDPAHPQTLLRMADGQTFRLNTSALIQAITQSDVASEAGDVSSNDERQIVVPLVEERLEVGKRQLVTGTVRLHTSTQEYTQALDEVLAVRTFDVERVVINRPVEIAPPIRQEGNVTIYSLVEEEIVLTKQLVLKEEVRIVQRDTERRDTRIVTLHKEHLTVEREKV